MALIFRGYKIGRRAEKILASLRQSWFPAGKTGISRIAGESHNLAQGG
jgi:hypothetical protein